MCHLRSLILDVGILNVFSLVHYNHRGDVGAERTVTTYRDYKVLGLIGLELLALT